MSLDAYLNEKLRQYQYKDLCKRQIVPATTAYKDLRPSAQKFVHNDGRETELFVLEGTIPVNFRGSVYNIPICLFLQERHPFVPPIVYVRPTNTMAIRMSKHVDNTGRVFMPFLAEWKHPGSDLAALIQILCCVFAEEPPVYAKPQGYTPPQQPGFQGHYGGGYPPTTSSTPPYTTSSTPPYTTSSTPPYPSGQHRMPTPVQMPMPGAGQRPPYQPPYPPTTSSSQYPRQQMPQFQSHGGHGGYPPVSQAAPTSHSSPLANQQLQTSRQASIPEETIKASLLSAVEGKLRRRIKPTIDQAQMELDDLNRTQQELRKGTDSLQDMIRRLEKEQSDVENNLNILTQKNEEISDVINKLQSDSDKLNIDDAVVTTAPLYNQILNLFAEENAVEDTIYYLCESLRKEALDMDVFLKHIRALSRKQFMLRALLYTARKTAGLSGMAGT